MVAVNLGYELSTIEIVCRHERGSLSASLVRESVVFVPAGTTDTTHNWDRGWDMLFGRKQRNPIKIADKGVVEWRYATCGYCSTGCALEIGRASCRERV